MAEQRDLFEKIADNFAELSRRERQFLKDRFGIELIEMPSLEEVSRAFQRARAKIREFEHRATAGMRKAPGEDARGGAQPAGPPSD